MNKRVLLIVDPQNDFCDLPPGAAGGYTPALPVPGAYLDMCRIATFIKTAPAGFFDTVVVTLDSHPEVAIERPNFWKMANGCAPEPFSTVSAADVLSGRITPVDESVTSAVLAYLEELEAAGKYAHTIWPSHCVTGTTGAAVLDELTSALEEISGHTKVVYVKKGTNPLTEHYSAVRAEVPIDGDSATDVNPELVAIAAAASEIFVAGEAGSHCVKATVSDLVTYALGNRADTVRLIVNAMSPVHGCAEIQASFIESMVSRGAKSVTI